MLPSRHADMEGVRMKLLDEYKLFVQNSQYTPRDSAFFTLLSNRFSQPGKPVLRGYFVTLMGRYLEAECGQSIPFPKYVLQKVLPFVSEVLMVVMYYDNQILDRKAGVATHDRIYDNLTISKILLSELRKYVKKRIYKPSLRDKVINVIDDVYEIVNIGQKTEQNCNRYENWLNGWMPPFQYLNIPFDEHVISQTVEIINRQDRFDLGSDKQAFLDMYVRRIYLTNAYLFVNFSNLISEFTPDLSEQIKCNVHRFAGYTGIAFQIINDVIDFVPAEYNKGSQAKTCDDAFSDLKNQNITLPLIFHLNTDTDSGISQCKLFLDQLQQGIPKPYFNDYEFCREILRSGAIDSNISCLVSMKEEALKYLNTQNIYFPFLLDMLCMVEHGKYHNILRRIKKGKLPCQGVE